MIYQLMGNKQTQKGERTYWNYDRWLKNKQTKSGSVSGASGALYAVRKKIFSPVPTGVTDDFYTAMQVVSSHFRLIFEPRAITYGPVAANTGIEFKRKIRIVTRGLYGIWLMRHLFNPFKYGFFSFQLFTHKVMRRFVVIPLFFLMISNPFLWQLGYFYQAIIIGQTAFHLFALTGYFLQNYNIGHRKIFNIPFHIDMVYLAVAIAIVNNLKGLKYSTWGPNRNGSSD